MSEVEARPSTPRRRPSLDFITPVIRTTPKMASPALMRSPFMKGRDRSGSLSQQEGGPALSSSLPRHAAYMQRAGLGPSAGLQPRNYGAMEDGSGLPARAGSLNRPVFGKATRPSGVDFADDGTTSHDMTLSQRPRWHSCTRLFGIHVIVCRRVAVRLVWLS